MPHHCGGVFIFLSFGNRFRSIRNLNSTLRVSFKTFAPRPIVVEIRKNKGIMTHVKDVNGYDVKVPSMGQANYNSVAGSLGLASFLGLGANGNGNGLLGNLFGGNRNGCCESDHLVNRYELAMEQQLAAKDSRIALLEANTYNDQKTLELYRYIDGKLNIIDQRLAAQDVRNQGVADAIREVSKDIDYKVNLEAERRCCADQRLVAYMNGTFAPKLIADYTAGTTTTLSNTFNPLCCECNNQ